MQGGGPHANSTVTECMSGTTGKLVDFDLLGDYFPDDVLKRPFTIAHLEYLRMRYENSKNRFRLVIEGNDQVHFLPSKCKIDDVNEAIKTLVALGIERGDFKAINDVEARQARDHLTWFRNSEVKFGRRNQATDGLISRFKLAMREYSGEVWDEEFMKAVKVEILIDGRVAWRENMHLKWDTSLESIVKCNAHRISCNLDDFSLGIKVDGNSILPILDRQIGELAAFEDRLNLRLEFFSFEMFKTTSNQITNAK